MASLISACFLIASFILQSGATSGLEDCDGTFCFTKPSNYPEETIEELLKLSPLAYDPNDEDNNEDLQKLLYESDDEMNCRSEVRLKSPFTVRHEGRTFPVVQSKYFSQKIRDVSCRKSDDVCFKDISLKSGLAATCETKKSEIQLYVIDEQTNKLVSLPVPFNCCCKCTIRDTRPWR